MADDPDRAVSVAGVAAQSPSMPGFRIRVGLLREELRRHGIDIEPFLLLTETEAQQLREAPPLRRARTLLTSRRRLLGELRANGGAFDATLIQRQADLLPSLRVEQAAVDHQRLIWDVDDAIWLDTSREARLHPLAFLKGTRRKVRWLAERADEVIAGNRLLAEWLSRHSDRVTVVPSLVETRQLPLKRHEDGDTVTLGWIGSAGTSRYLVPIGSLLTELSRLAPERTFRLMVVGGKITPPQGIEVEQLEWSPEAEEKALAAIDIGLMPMPDTPWTRGKCAYKALQYMSAGIPAVADDVGVSRDVVAEGGIIVRREGEWLTALIDLTRDYKLRSRLGAAARRQVEAHYSVERWAPVLAGIIRGDRSGAHPASPRESTRTLPGDLPRMA
jgi:glycosyltransferase involved in cell wall biosynthesis